jgi:hypothetical protein
MATTIHDLADSARRRGIEHLGEAAFARLCMEFDSQVPAANIYARYVSVIQRLAVEGQEDGKTMQIGLCWLDGNGFGDKSVEWLGQELGRVKKERGS